MQRHKIQQIIINLYTWFFLEFSSWWKSGRYIVVDWHLKGLAALWPVCLFYWCLVYLPKSCYKFWFFYKIPSDFHLVSSMEFPSVVFWSCKLGVCCAPKDRFKVFLCYILWLGTAWYKRWNICQFHEETIIRGNLFLFYTVSVCRSRCWYKSNEVPHGVQCSQVSIDVRCSVKLCNLCHLVII
jgi:hypothetical protein